MVSDIKKSLDMGLDMNSVLSEISCEMESLQTSILNNNKINTVEMTNFLKKESCFTKSFDKEDIQDIYLSNKGDIIISCQYVSFRNYERYETAWKVIIPDNIIEAYEKYNKENFECLYEESQENRDIYYNLLKKYMENILSEKIIEYKLLIEKQQKEKKITFALRKKKEDEEAKALYETLKLRFEGDKK